jgi:hypothetical protein
MAYRTTHARYDHEILDKHPVGRDMMRLQGDLLDHGLLAGHLDVMVWQIARIEQARAVLAVAPRGGATLTLEQVDQHWDWTLESHHEEPRSHADSTPWSAGTRALAAQIAARIRSMYPQER